MAKTVKQKPEAAIETDLTQPGISEPVFMPDVPSQAQPQEIVKEDSDEVRFLKHILHIQEIGGFGRHLHTLINDRIKQLS